MPPGNGAPGVRAVGFRCAIRRIGRRIPIGSFGDGVLRRRQRGRFGNSWSLEVAFAGCFGYGSVEFRSLPIWGWRQPTIRSTLTQDIDEPRRRGRHIYAIFAPQKRGSGRAASPLRGQDEDVGAVGGVGGAVPTNNRRELSSRATRGPGRTQQIRPAGESSKYYL